MTSKELIKKYGEDPTLEQKQEINEQISKEKKEVVIEKRRLYALSLTKQGRRFNALDLLQKQLASGLKPVSKGQKPFKKDENGNIEMEEVKDHFGETKPIRLNVIPMTAIEIMNMTKQTLSLKRKLNLATI